MLKVGLIGHGAIGKLVAESILHSTHGLSSSRISLVAILVNSAREQTHVGNAIITNDPSIFFGSEFDICIECAGQPAVRQHAVNVLSKGINFLCTSIGALTNDALMEEIKQAAIDGKSQFSLASGAMPAIDWMSSSALEPGSIVTAIQTKPPKSWIGARYEPFTTNQLPDVIDFSTLDKPNIFFEGTARDAASSYPKNSNVLAMLAISTAGLDETQVKLVADPLDTTMRQTIEYNGSAGKIVVNVVGKCSPTNPRTSQIVPLSVIKALRNMSSPISIGL